MSGISISNFRPPGPPPAAKPTPPALFLCLLVSGLWPLQARADIVNLGEESRVSGHITAIDAEGRVTLDSDLSEKPLRILAEAVKSIHFDPAINDKLAVPDQEIQLSNGDAIPCRIESMDEKSIHASTWYAGKLEIPREYVAALHFGISKPRPVLATAKAIQGWSKSDAWQINEENTSLVSSDTGRIARQLDDPLPERFIIRFRYRWKGSPNLRFHFAADQFDKSPANRYILTINTAGIEIKRQSSRGRTYTTLSQSPRRPETAWPDGMNIELRVDRSLKEPLFLLFINDELVDRFTDAVKTPPSGSGLMLESNAGNRSGNIVSNLEILEWDGDSSNRRKREKSASASDSVYDREGQHFTGRAGSISMYDGRLVIVFHHPRATEPFRIPLDQAASLWFHQPDPAPAPDIPETPLVLGLVDNGLLHIESCVMDERHAECTHPLLGKLSIKRRAVSTINPGKKEKGS